MILWLIGLYETTDDLELFVGHCDLYFMIGLMVNSNSSYIEKATSLTNGERFSFIIHCILILLLFFSSPEPKAPGELIV